MKQVRTNKRKYTVKDLFRFSAKIFINYLIFFLYAIIFMIIRHYTGDGTFFPKLEGHKIWILYSLLFAPGLNGVLHITYAEVGSPWTRFAMWMNSIINMFLIPCIIFLF